MTSNRRKFLAMAGSATTAVLAGCLGGSSDGSSGSSGGGTPVTTPGSADPTPLLVEADIAPEGLSAGCPDLGSPDLTDGPPTDDRQLTLVDCPDALAEDIVNGGVPKDGIPSIDDPSFVDVDEADTALGDDDPVFGVVRNGVAKAYQQRILVSHEIVNDEIGGENVTVTYCPLTGTVQGFLRGDTEFGVSGELLNSNLVMYDRATDSYWPQMLARSITGPATGATLREFSVHWTTWGRWREAYPDSDVLSEDTGFARSYDRDPYGSYAPRSGHYADGSLLFDGYVEDASGRLHPKDVVIGARTETGALAVEKNALREHGVVSGPLGGVDHVAVYEPTLDTGYVYRNDEGETVEYADGGVLVDGTEHAPDDLPLESLVKYDSMWFAWYGYYPHTTLIRRDPSEVDDGE